MSAYKFTPRAVASPDAPQKPLVRKRAHSDGADWVRVTRERSPSKAKRPWTAGSQQPACTHKEHQILTTAEAASFASQFWDCKVHPTKASLHEFLATCIDVDLEKSVQHAQWQWSLPLWKGATMRTIRIQSNQWSLEHCSVLCIVQSAGPFAQKCDHLPPPPPPHTSLKRPSLTGFKKCTHTPPPKRQHFGAWDQKFTKPRKSAKTDCVGAYRMSPRDIGSLPRVHPSVFQEGEAASTLSRCLPSRV